LRFALLLGRLGPPPHVLEEPLARERALEPVQELRGRIDLIVVLPLREDGHLVKVFGEPGRRLRDVDEAILALRPLFPDLTIS
jgi:hypothetical protein